MLTASSIWLFIIPFAIAAAIPGPAQGALLGQVVSRGARSTLSFVAGMVLGNAVWLLVATLGLAALAVQFEQVFVAIKWLGLPLSCSWPGTCGPAMSNYLRHLNHDRPAKGCWPACY